MKKYLVLVLAIFLWAGNAYAVRYDATGIWNIMNDWTFTPYGGGPQQTGTDPRIWDIVDNLIDNTFTLDYIGPENSGIVTGEFDDNDDKYYADPFISTAPDKKQYVDSLSFWLTTPTTLFGISDIRHCIPSGEGGWNEVGTIHCEYTGKPVPEPATLLLLGSGLAALAGFGRKKFKK
jgi:hypothetical protein